MKPLLWLAIGGVATGLALLLVKRPKAPLPATLPAAPPPTPYGEAVRVTLEVPAGWRRVTDAEVSAAPDLGTRANALRNSPGFTSKAYGTLAPFTASDGNVYATWIEQHYHEPGGAVKPWGLHHGVTLLAKAALAALADKGAQNGVHRR